MKLFRNRAASPAPYAPPPIELPSGESVPVLIRSSARARRIALRLHPASAAVELVLPAGAPLARAIEFLDSRRGWVAAQIARMPPRVPFAEGARIPVLGIEHVLRSLGPGRGRDRPFRIVPGAIEVTGRPEHLARRTRAGLRDHALGLLSAKTRALAGQLGLQIGRISVGDARSRWGSCARSGNIKYSWRLVLAPERVLDYVVAHEVAHLVEMNHSPRFWRVVDELHTGHARERQWLKRHGPRLLRYG